MPIPSFTDQSDRDAYLQKEGRASRIEQLCKELFQTTDLSKADAAAVSALIDQNDRRAAQLEARLQATHVAGNDLRILRTRIKAAQAAATEAARESKAAADKREARIAERDVRRGLKVDVKQDKDRAAVLILAETLIDLGLLKQDQLDKWATLNTDELREKLDEVKRKRAGKIREAVKS